MSRKTINFITIFFYISLILGFILNEDLNRGARSDFNFYENIPEPILKIDLKIFR